MKTGLKPPLLGMLLLPMLSMATGCSSPDSSPEAAPPSASPSSSASSGEPSSSAAPGSSRTAVPTSAPETSAAEGTGTAPDAVVQSPQPAPEPTFEAEQEQYLQDKVPEGGDPNAVLQVGQERCDQLLSARAIDEESVLSELIMSPARDTADAVAALCPELLPVLEAAKLGFPDGVFSVGAAAPHGEQPSIAPGIYRAYGQPEGCLITVYTGSGELLGSHDGSAPVTIGADAARVESDQCYTWFRS
ncbi:hypothetical protein [Arthrobacter zhaoxinii]|uniref:hypothetical protein n=1 Tax=Arthrobacter zhaoxinii TaxID=2964616 RepID=UPI002102BF69|nr:hypothetical protein [Arthrobacter zhaoxinii]MCQ2001743.1 hypothetical protein [Arthrobacter zhaoxinii]